MTTLEIILSIVAGIETLILLAIIVNKLKHRAPGGVTIKNGVRYTKTSKINKEDQSVNISYNKTDLVLVADKVYTVSKTGELKPGKYIILSTQEGKTYLTMKINDFARNQKHGAEVVFAEGDIVIAVNEPIILR